MVPYLPVGVVHSKVASLRLDCDDFVFNYVNPELVLLLYVLHVERSMYQTVAIVSNDDASARMSIECSPANDWVIFFINFLLVSPELWNIYELSVFVVIVKLLDLFKGS